MPWSVASLDSPACEELSVHLLVLDEIELAGVRATSGSRLTRGLSPLYCSLATALLMADANALPLAAILLGDAEGVTPAMLASSDMSVTVI